MPIEGTPLLAPVDLTTVLAHGLAASPDTVAVQEQDASATWRTLDAQSAGLAAGFRQLGIRAGDRVASLVPNRTALLVHYLACLRSGLVATPLNYRYTAAEIDHTLSTSCATALVVHADRLSDVARSREVGRLPAGLVVVEADDGDLAGARRFESLTATDPGSVSFEPGAADDPAAIFFTSGSTGTAKGVTHSLTTLGWNVAAVVAALDLTERDRVLPASSMSHIAAFLWGLATLSAGACLVLARTFDAAGVRPLLREHRPTALAMIPAALTAVLRARDVSGDDFASLRLCHAAGDKVPPQLGRDFRRVTGLDIDEGYGMTEVGLTTINPPSGVIKAGSIGRPVPGVAVSVRDAVGGEVAPGEVGRMWIRPPRRATSYWEQPQASADVVRHGWVDSGDLAHYDADGYLWFFGRQKQVIVHDGSNISPIEVEAALVEHAAVAQVAVVGVPDAVHGENVLAYVALKEGVPPPSAAELVECARARIGYKAPEVIVLLDELPQTATGKVDRVLLKRMAAVTNGSAMPPADVGAAKIEMIRP